MTKMEEKRKPDITLPALIETERLFIEPISFKDTEFVLELVNTQGWLEYIGDRKIHSLSDAQAYIQKIIDNPDVRYWTVRNKQEPGKAGIITFIKRNYLAFHDIGFAFLPAFFGRGYAYEASMTLLLRLIETEQHSYINAVTLPKNIPSIALLGKMGLQLKQEIEVEKETLQVHEAPVDKLLISSITHSFYSAFTNKYQGKPKMHLLSEHCIPRVLIIKIREGSADVMDLPSFMEPRINILTNGTLQDFEEKEIFEETKIVNGIAQRYSLYEKTGIINGLPFKTRGHKLFQFLRTRGLWKISSVTWEDEETLA